MQTERVEMGKKGQISVEIRLTDGRKIGMIDKDQMSAGVRGKGTDP